jgi:ABC-type Na+ efflux pump permease subunit
MKERTKEKSIGFVFSPLLSPPLLSFLTFLVLTAVSLSTTINEKKTRKKEGREEKH